MQVCLSMYDVLLASDIKGLNMVIVRWVNVGLPYKNKLLP